MTKQHTHSWLLETEDQLVDLLNELRSNFHVEEAGQVSQRASYLDTYDWRIWRHGDVLEYIEQKKHKKLVWRHIDHAVVHVEIPLDTCPTFVNDIPGWLQPEVLMKITRPRALIQIATSRQKIQTYDIQDSSDKVVSRISVVKENVRHTNNRSGQALANRLQVELMRGYEAEFRVVETIMKRSGMAAYGKDPLARLMNLQDRRPCDYSSRLRLRLASDDRADASAKQILLQLSEMMTANEKGIIADVDTEFLHDYRYSIQRSHSLLKQLKHVIPEDTRRRFDQDLLWIDQQTSQLFELNSWLLNFDDYRQLVDKRSQPDLDGLQNWLRRQRQLSLKQVVKLFKSAEYKKFMKRWHVYLACDVPGHSVLKRAEKPVLEIANGRIWKAYKKLISHKDANLMKLAPNDLQMMRTACATLVDLLALSRTLNADKATAELYESLQSFQIKINCSADWQQRGLALRAYADEMKAQKTTDKRTPQAIDKLLHRILDKQSDSLKYVQPAYVGLVSAHTRASYQRIFKSS